MRPDRRESAAPRVPDWTAGGFEAHRAAAAATAATPARCPGAAVADGESVASQPDGAGATVATRTKPAAAVGVSAEAVQTGAAAPAAAAVIPVESDAAAAVAHDATYL